MRRPKAKAKAKSKPVNLPQHKFWMKNTGHPDEDRDASIPALTHPEAPAGAWAPRCSGDRNFQICQCTAHTPFDGFVFELRRLRLETRLMMSERP